MSRFMSIACDEKELVDNVEEEVKNKIFFLPFFLFLQRFALITQLEH